MAHICESCGNWFYGLIGVLFLAVGYLLWVGTWSLEQGVGAVVAIWGIKKLAHCCAPMMKK